MQGPTLRRFLPPTHWKEKQCYLHRKMIEDPQPGSLLFRFYVLIIFLTRAAENQWFSYDFQATFQKAYNFIS